MDLVGLEVQHLESKIRKGSKVVMKKYKQLNLEERVTIKIGLQQKLSIREISRMLDRSPSIISREIQRGITVNGTYFAESTERLLKNA